MTLERGGPDFFRRVVAQRLAVLRMRSKLPAAPDFLDPLPQWFLPRIDEARNIRVALREVSLFREKAIALQRFPEQAAYEFGTSRTQSSTVEDEAVNFDKCGRLQGHSSRNGKQAPYFYPGRIAKMVDS